MTTHAEKTPRLRAETNAWLKSFLLYSVNKIIVTITLS